MIREQLSSQTISDIRDNYTEFQIDGSYNGTKDILKFLDMMSKEFNISKEIILTKILDDHLSRGHKTILRKIEEFKDLIN